jgi:hypothetical protein
MELSKMPLGVHALVQHAHDSDSPLRLHVEDDMVCVLKAEIALTQVTNRASDRRLLGQQRK